MSTLPFSPYERLPTQPYPSALLFDRPCPLTGDQGLCETIFEMPDFQFYTDQHGQNRVLYRVVRNLNSGLIYMNPCYTQTGFDYLFEQSGESNFNYGQLSHMNERLDWINRYVAQYSSVLDVGCGTGQFLRALPTDVKRMGVEIIEAPLERAKSFNPGTAEDIDYYCQDFSTFQCPDSIDLITMYHVLEHLTNPLEVLQNLRKNAQPNTHLIVEVPVLDYTLESNELPDVVGFFTAIHLTHFTRVSFEIMIENAGWDITHSEQIPTSSNGYRVVARPGTPKTQVLSDSAINRDKENSQRYLTLWGKRMEQVKKTLGGISTKPKILIWGCGHHTEYMHAWTPLFTLGAQYLMVDKDPLKIGKTYHGIPVVHPDSIPAEIWANPDFHVVISSFFAQQNIVDSLCARQFPKQNLTVFYEPTMIKVSI